MVNVQADRCFYYHTFIALENLFKFMHKVLKYLITLNIHESITRHILSC